MPAVDVKTLHAKIGELTLGERILMRRGRQGGFVAEPKAMIDKSHVLAVARQAEMLGISGGSVFYLPRPTPPADLALMRRIDELDLDNPFVGSCMVQHLLSREGFEVGRLHVKTIGIEAIYRRANIWKPEPGHKIFPHLLRKVPATAPNEVWAMDIT